jgi:hypothetical protein
VAEAKAIREAQVTDGTGYAHETLVSVHRTIQEGSFPLATAALLFFRLVRDSSAPVQNTRGAVTWLVLRSVAPSPEARETSLL